MSPITHFLAGWVTANTASLNRHERAIVTIAGIAPDVDGLGIIAELATRDSAHPLLWWTDYHHVFGHNLLFGVAFAAVAWALAARRWRVAALAFASFHLHLLGDLVGARGPDGYIWTIPYLWPFSAAGVWSWPGQWKLNAWPNLLLTALLLAWTFYRAWRRGCSPLEMFSARMDGVFVSALRQRFGKPPTA
ncbi:MAG: metal-dependent hydrolase [Verrucomicrobia bacterium]|nr:metal-dependent hydrolase [Verrucomicrobiota bacterium]